MSVRDRLIGIGTAFAFGIAAIPAIDMFHDRSREGVFNITAMNADKGTVTVGHSGYNNEFNIAAGEIEELGMYDCTADGSILTTGLGMHYMGVRESLSDCSPSS